jgi:hypothetical protein
LTIVAAAAGNDPTGAPAVNIPAAALGIAPPPPLYLNPASVASSTPSCRMASAISLGGGTCTRVGKNPGFFKNPAQCFFGGFMVFLGFFCFFLNIFAQKREFRVFFSFQTLNYNHSL